MGRLGIASAALVACALPVRVARAEEAPSASAAFLANEGLRVGVGPVIIIPTNGRSVGGGLDVDARYGIRAGPTVLAPGGRLSGYVFSSRFVGIPLATFRVTVPVGFLAPFVLGGVGPGWVSNPTEGGVAFLGGGGLMIHLGRVFAIGAEATFQTITGTEFQSFAIGPSLLFGT